MPYRLRASPFFKYQEFLPGLDDWKLAIGKVAVGRAGPKASGVCVTLGVEGAEVMFGSIVLDLEIVGDCFASRMVAKDHLAGRLFEVEVLHHVEYWRVFFVAGSSSRGSRRIA